MWHRLRTLDFYLNLFTLIPLGGTSGPNLVFWWVDDPATDGNKPPQSILEWTTCLLMSAILTCQLRLPLSTLLLMECPLHSLLSHATVLWVTWWLHDALLCAVRGDCMMLCYVTVMILLLAYVPCELVLWSAQDAFYAFIGQKIPFVYNHGQPWSNISLWQIFSQYGN